MRSDDSGPDAEDDQRDQHHRERDTTRECLQRAIAVAFVGHHEIEAGTEVVGDGREKKQDQNRAEHWQSSVSVRPAGGTADYIVTSPWLDVGTDRAGSRLC